MFSRRNLLIASALSAVSLPTFAAPRYTAGKEYLVLNPAQPTPQDKIEVVLFFAYTCSHCMQFEPVFEKWKAKLPADVVVRYNPVAWQPKFLPFTQAYYAFDALKLLDKLHMAFFESIIYQTRSYNFDDPAADIAAFVKENGVDVNLWNKTMASFGVQNKARIAMQTWQAYGIDATPMIGVGGRYTTGPHLVGTREATTGCLDFLIDEVRKSRR